jgi:hypothetical protein
MPLIEASGTSLDRIRPDSGEEFDRSGANLRQHVVVRTELLFGNTWMSTRPPLSFRIASAASLARTFSGWIAGRLLANLSLNSAVCAWADVPIIEVASVLAVRADGCDKNPRRATRFMLSPGSRAAAGSAGAGL